MSVIHRYGVFSLLVLSIAAGCGDDDDVPTPTGEAGAAGEPSSAAGAPTNNGGAAGEATGVGGVAGEGGGLLESGGASGDAGMAGVGGAVDALASFKVWDVNDVKTNPEAYEWFDFRPNVKKLILAGAAETEHIAILWYTVTDGGVALHYHAKTESVYVIDGTQTDGKGTYPTGTVYFNPPGSGHVVTNSSGFFLLAYAAPPDFASTDLIEDYTPVSIDTTTPNLTTELDFVEKADGVSIYAVPTVQTGGLSAELIHSTASGPYAFEGNYLLVLEGSCNVGGVALAPGMLVVAPSIAKAPYQIAATDGTCLALGVSF